MPCCLSSVSASGAPADVLEARPGDPSEVGQRPADGAVEDANRSVDARRDDVPAVGAERRAREGPIRPSQEWIGHESRRREQPAGGRLPEPSGERRRRNDPTAVRAERRRLDGREVSSQHVRESAGGSHHDARVVVVAGGHHEPAAPAELGIPDRLRVPDDPMEERSGVDLPKAGEVVAARRQDKASVGTEGHSSDRAPMSKDVELPAGRDLPQPRRLIVAARADQLAVRAEGDGMDRAAVSAGTARSIPP
jgi:hypothetical protein